MLRHYNEMERLDRQYSIFTPKRSVLRGTSFMLAFSLFIMPLAPAALAQSEQAADPVEASAAPAEANVAAADSETGQASPGNSGANIDNGNSSTPGEPTMPDLPDQAKPDEPGPPVTEPEPVTLPAAPSDFPNFDRHAVTKPGELPQPEVFTGALVHRFPISVPPGRNGLQPSVELVYNSQKPDIDSIVGSGWELSIPSIRRLNKRGTDDLFSSDTFFSTLDGELVHESGSTYVPKIENGEYRSYSFSSNAWTVTDKRGTVYTFGSGASSRQDDPSDSSKVFKWLVDEVRDTNDNFITYSFLKHKGTVYPDTITYTGHGATAGVMTVEFDLETRPDFATSSDTGFLVTTEKRVQTIRAEVDGSWVRSYALSYTSADNGNVSLLSSITESGRNELGNTVALPAETYTYQTGTDDWDTVTTLTVPESVCGDGSNYSDDLGVRFADINGDGLTDVVKAFDDGSNHTAVYLHNGSGWDSVSWSVPAVFSYHALDRWGSRLVDVNGDNLLDFLVAYNDAGSVVKKVYINDGDSWDYDSSWSLPVHHVYNSGDQGVRYGDVNGDGLVDIVAINVHLNTGTGWQQHATWTAPLAFASSNKDTGARLIDINDDGLADVIRSYRDTQNRDTNEVYINTGSSWELHATGTIPALFTRAGDDKGVRFLDVNGDSLVDIVQSYRTNDTPGTIIKKVYVNNGDLSWSDDSSWAVPELFVDAKTGVCTGSISTDIDGDGLGDIIRAYTSATSTNINDQEFELLSSIEYPGGGSTAIEYNPTSLYEDGDVLGNPSLPYIMHTVSTTTHSDGLGSSETTNYTYGGGERYFGGPFDREFVGFATTTKTDPLGNVTKTYYHQGNGSQTSLGEYDDDVSKIGKPYRVEEYDDSDNLFNLTVNMWDYYALNATSSFVKLATTTKLTYDGDGDHKDTATEYTYDNDTGDVTNKTEYGEVSASSDGSFSDTGSDKRSTDITYAASSTGYLIVPKQETLKDNGGTTVADTKYYYDTLSHGSVNKGNPTKVEQWVEGSTWIDTEKTYNSYGLVTQEKDPRDKTTSYTYDSYNLYPATTTNPESHVTQREYDYSSGKVATTTDANNFVFAVVYDGLDRQLTEKQPDLTTPSTLVTKTAYTYTDTKNETKVQRTDYLDSSTAMDTYRYYDGLGRLIQSRNEAQGTDTFVATDRIYNERGELAYESLPYFSSGAASTSATTDTDLLTAYTYDPLGRPLTMVNAAGTTTYAYDQWETVTTDVNGNLKDLHHDAFDRLASVEEHNDGSTYTTSYTYSPQDNLTKITDALSNVRSFTYDGLGRRTSAEDLHASADSSYGTYYYAYDAAGNVSSSTDPNGDATNYTYDDINRPLTEDNLSVSGTEITYGYDTCTYGVGHLCGATTTDAASDYAYNALGLTATEGKTVQGTRYETAYDFDRQSNPTKITYPDDSEVVYEYDSSGRPVTIKRKEDADASYSTVNRYLTYTPIETLEYFEYGDGSYTYNDYDPDELYRLRYKASIAYDHGELGTGIPAFVGGNGDVDVPANLARMRKSVPEKIKTLAAHPERYRGPGADIPSIAHTNLPVKRISYDRYAPPRTVTPEERAYMSKQQAARNTVTQDAPDSHRTAPSSSFEIGNTTAMRSISPTGDVSYLLSTVNPPRTSQELNVEDLWITDTLMNNRSFETNLDHWTYWAGSGSSITRDCTTSTDGSCSLKAYNATAGNEWDTAMQQRFRIEPNTTYKVRFKAKGTATSSFWSLVGQDYSPWYTYGFSKGINVTPDWRTFEYTFRSSATTSDEITVLYFGFGTNVGTYYIDDVQLLPDDLTVVRNPSFESGNINGWYFGGGGGLASYSVDCSGDMTDGVCGTQVDFSATGTYWYVEFSHNNVDVTSGADYVLTFDVKATEDRHIHMELGQAHSPWNLLAPAVIVQLDTDWTHYVIPLTANASDSNARIGFYMGDDDPTVLIDNVRFWQATNTKMVDMTPEFSARYDDPDSPDTATYYQLQVDPYWADFSDPMWDSTKTAMASTSEGSRTPDISYAGSTLYPEGEQYRWRIKLWDESDNEGEYTNGDDFFYTAGNQVQQATYAYDRAGNVTQIIESTEGSNAKNYVHEYDDLNRLATTSTSEGYPSYVGGHLTAASPDTTLETYAYNAIGNITSKSDIGSYTYAGTSYANPHAVTSVNGQTYSYDNNGNLTSDGTRTNTWNYRNQLETTVKGGTTYGYGYDHTGQRTLYGDGSATTTYANKYYDQKGSTVTKHLYFPHGDLFATIEGSDSNAVLKYIHTDHLGSTKAVTEDGGATVQLLDYWPFGGERVNQQFDTFDESRKFTGHEYDDGTNLYYMQARYQNPEVGRFVSQDPVFVRSPELYLPDPQQANSYSYARNNPLAYIDPTGELVQLVARPVSGTVIGTHIFWHVTPTIGPSQPGKELYHGQEFTVGGYNRLESDPTQGGAGHPFGNILVKDLGYADDPTPNSDWINGAPLAGTDRLTITPPNGMSEDAFVKSLLRAHNSIEDRSAYNLFEGNSNDFAYEIARRAGVADQFRSFDYTGYAPGAYPWNFGTIESAANTRSINLNAPSRGGGYDGYAQRRGLTDD